MALCHPNALNPKCKVTGEQGCKASIDRVLGKVYSRSHDAVIRVYDEGGNVIETHEHKGDFKEW
jgi:hypothetical protein